MGLETSSEGYITLVYRVDAELTNLDEERLATIPRDPPFEGLSSTLIETNDEGEVAPPHAIAGIVKD